VALRGTLKEFRIADIFQLISQQAKTGTLRFKSRRRTVWVSFLEGWIVRVEDSRKSSQETICEMLLRAELILQEDLDIALDVHKRMRRSLREVLSLRKLLPEEKFNELVLLQMREALYELFTWDSGKYEFENSVLSEGTWGRLNTESILMDGFRVVDEWPELRRRIVDEEARIEKVLPLPELAGGGWGDSRSMLGIAERQVYELAKMGLSVRKVVDLSCLGRFDGFRALANLVEQGCIQLSSPSHGGKVLPGRQRRWLKVCGRIGAVLFYLMVVSMISAGSNGDIFGWSAGRNVFTNPVLRRHIARAQTARIEAAIEVYRLENATVPEELGNLVEARLLRADDLSHPWHTAYGYLRKSPSEYELLLPSE